MSTPEPTLVTPAALREWPLPPPGEGKHGRGELVVVGGTSSTPGAVLLAAEAALRAGSGKLQLLTAADVAPALAVAVPESLTVGLRRSPSGGLDVSSADEVRTYARDADAVLLGPGLLDVAEAVALLEAVGPALSGPVVLDALGSAYLTEHPDGLHHLGGRAVLTVNPTELARTAGRDDAEVAADLLSVARQVARASGLVVLCGGTAKTVAAPDGRCWRVEGGSPGLGVSGSGDVQAGIVAGLLARGSTPEQAAVWGGAVHARAGERLSARVGTIGFLARELPAEVPGVLAELG